MARPVSEKVGRGTCPEAHCNEPVMYRRSSGGMLTHKCENCDSSGYCTPGGTAHAARMATIKTAAPAPTPQAEPAAPPTEAAPAPKPAAKKIINSAFSLGDL